MSQDLFQKKMDEVLFGLDGVISIADDICVFGRDPEEHSKRLRELMNRARDKGLVFNADKCSINLKEITFFGQVYSAAGVAPDPAKVKAIKKHQTSTKCEGATIVSGTKHLPLRVHSEIL